MTVNVNGFKSYFGAIYLATVPNGTVDTDFSTNGSSTPVTWVVPSELNDDDVYLTCTCTQAPKVNGYSMIEGSDVSTQTRYYIKVDLKNDPTFVFTLGN